MRLAKGDVTMDKTKRRRLEKAGWTVGSAGDFLELSDVENALVEIKLRLSENLKAVRSQRHLSQSELAKRIGSSQSRIAKMEAGDPSVSLDLLIRAHLAAGATRRDLAKVVG
jgi:DNA-binding XRE family transcriptional regulator